ncbi:MAG: crotonobetainyl-CoA:carnitine CoA-transferase CaiB-like acyl-CoA transferase [Marinobacter maritimus]|jgi:crotonobetainyl-CoA:carnitine CoA-transferase CaiB-like acyl-CoA transferase|uniref:CaiB/BaiF CoA transferase family protein n=1 Tax=Marinobacter TaxID=2742 RepID=UPI000BD49737|nr:MULTISPECIES: CaiB/BaiF CoA-transferase family protein [Marinobacter]MAI34130.1 CoA transferase [Rhodopirellula sp.]MBL1273238.1 CoA transferase [Oceanospirillales bacterium]HCA10755.1 CoA transferase [Marinobacter adhaerens]MAK50789.1 CoA transferase [Marinobacter sp.]MBI47939.1 CoA transferase [Marinobacter sp.]|tara:strand:- start:16776 stop:17999 length:1224 start_codon:yes stop_codon:yes gene_type:complete
MAGPLSGIRVLDLSRVMAGPWCTQILADLGAEVIKIERPGLGDDTRHWGPPWFKDAQGNTTTQSAYYLSANRGKHSVTVDIGSEEGQALIRELAAECDVLVENFKTGGLDKKGLGYADLSKINPGLIYCSVTGFGHTGPMAADAGYDYLIQAQSGLMSITGVADGQPGAGPMRVGMAVADLTTGMNAVIAILSAVHHRTNTGEGQHLDMALLDVQVSWMANQAQNYFCSGKVPGRTGEYHPNLAPYQPFPTKDGKVIIAVGNDGQFQRLCKALGQPELAEDPRFATNPQRVLHREELVGKLCECTRTRTSREWMDCLVGVHVPCGPIQNLAEVFEDPQVLARNMKIELEHPQLGKVPGIANPIKFSKTPQVYRKAPPLLGEDTDTILQRVLDKSPEDIASLRARGVL